MVRSRAALAVGVLTLVAAAILIPVYAHDGHAKPQAGSLDPDAPKRVSQATARAIGLTTAEVDFGRVDDVVTLTGIVRARPGSFAAVAATYGGVVRGIAVEPGDRVRAGDVIAEVESPDLARAGAEVRRLDAEAERLTFERIRASARIASLEVEIPATERSAALAAAEVERLAAAGETVAMNLLAQRRAEADRLNAEAGLRRIGLQEARDEAASLARQIDAARGAAEAQRATLPTGPADGPAGRIRLTAPIDGVVVRRAGVIGGGVEAGAEIVGIGDYTRVRIEGEVPEGLLGRVEMAKDAAVRVRRGAAAGGDVVAEGVTRFLSPVIDRTRRTAALVVEVENAAGLLRDGQFVELSVVLASREDAVVVPATAVVKEGPVRVVFVQEGEGAEAVFRRREVAVGVADDRVVEITLGLVPGDIVAATGAFSLSQLRGVAPAGTEETPATAGEHSHGGHGHPH